GSAAGGGLELVLASHLRIASSDAEFSLPTTVCEMSQRLRREIGESLALELTMNGKSLSAREAHEMGLINQVCAGPALFHEAESLAKHIARLAPLAVRACLKVVTEGVELSLADGLRRETELFAKLFASNDMREGTRSFLEKREPVFNGT